MLTIGELCLDEYILDYTTTKKNILSDASGTSESGYEFRDIVRTDVYSVQATVDATPDIISQLSSLLSEKKLRVNFLDLSTGVIKSEVSMFLSSDLSPKIILENQSIQLSFELQEF